MVDKKIIGIENSGNGAKLLILSNENNFELVDMPRGIIRLDNLNYDDIFNDTNNKLPLANRPNS
jgi:hypothetical protein